jgi:tetratricopeptide (TPR) repeat protein
MNNTKEGLKNYIEGLNQLVVKKNTLEGIATLIKAVDQLGKHKFAWFACYNLGVIFLETHEYDKAIKYLNKLSSLPEPKQEEFYKYTESEQHSNDIQNANLLLCDAYFGKVNELLDKHEFDQAIHICKKVISFDYKDMMGPAYYNLGQCVTGKAIQLLRKDRVNAIKLLDESVKYMEKSSALGFELAIKALKRNK